MPCIASHLKDSTLAEIEFQALRTRRFDFLVSYAFADGSWLELSSDGQSTTAYLASGQTEGRGRLAAIGPAASF